MVHIVGIIIQDGVFGGLIYFLSPIIPNWDIVNEIYTDEISTRHLQHILDLRPATQPPLLDILNYLIYLQQGLESFFAHCNLILPFKLLYTYNVIEICKSVY